MMRKHRAARSRPTGRGRALTALIAGCAISGTGSGWLHAGTSEELKYYQKKEEGWWWKEPITADSAQAPKPPAPQFVPGGAITPSESPRPLSPAWLREQLPRYRDLAVENPTPENVRAYFYLQQYAMNLAERFADTAQQVVLSDPWLDENSRRPISSYGGQVFDAVARQGMESVARKIASTAGVWYFYRSDCPYCAAENPVLERLQERIGLAVLPIALDGRAMPEGAFANFVPDRGHAEQLHVTATPTLYLVRPPGQFTLLSEGLLTDDALLDRMVQVAHAAGWITEEEYQSTRPRKALLMAADAQRLTDETLADPEKLIEALRAAPWALEAPEAQRARSPSESLLTADQITDRTLLAP
jgi:conjugal transfer pilus assembly protein TraF